MAYVEYPETQDGRKLRRYKRRWKIERVFAWSVIIDGSSSAGTIMLKISWDLYCLHVYSFC